MRLHGNEILEEETSNLFNQFRGKTGGIDPANFRSVCIEDIAVVEDIVQTDILLYDIDIAAGTVIDELARRSVGKHFHTVRLLRYNRHICDVSDIDALFKAYHCPTCDQFIKRTQHLERKFTTCKKRVTHVFPKSVYQLRETLFDKLYSFNIPYSGYQKLHCFLNDLESFIMFIS